VAACLDAQRPTSARTAVDELIERFPADDTSWYLAYQQAAAESDWERAALSLQATGYLRPLTRAEQRQLGDLFRTIGAPAAAIPYYEAALEELIGAPAGAAADRSADDRTAADQTVERSGSGSSAARAARERAEAYERLVAVHVAAHRSESALAVLERALAADPTARLWSLKGDVQYRAEDFEAAMTAYARAAELAPDHGRYHLMLGYCAWELGKKAEATGHLRRAAQDAATAEAANGLLRHLESLGE
jgi:tetratricopeptide (TPR) repeat protein